VVIAVVLCGRVGSDVDRGRKSRLKVGRTQRRESTMPEIDSALRVLNTKVLWCRVAVVSARIYSFL
jgi:hypothetical protein